MILWLLRRFRAFRELEDERDRLRLLCAYEINPSQAGNQFELERNLYEFLATRIPLGVGLMVLPTEESWALSPGLVAAQLVVPATRKAGS